MVSHHPDPETDVPARTNPPTATTAGILRPEEFARHVSLSRWPTGSLDRWVENFWGLRWSLPAGSSYLSHVLPHPACTVSLEHTTHPRPGLPQEAVVVTGVVTRRFDTVVAGDGAVVGVKFRPGGLAALTGLPARAWTDRDLPVADVLPAEVAATLQGIDPRTVLDEGPAEVEEALAQLTIRAGDDPTYSRLLAVVADMLQDRALLTVTQVEERHGVPGRTLQRWFSHYLGVGPKWVLARYRMHDVVTELDEGYAGSLADLAARHGWYDQSHLVRDFRSITGVTPGEYAAGRPQLSGNDPT
jgi:AraC-like DNA-binding protein